MPRVISPPQLLRRVCDDTARIRRCVNPQSHTVIERSSDASQAQGVLRIEMTKGSLAPVPWRMLGWAGAVWLVAAVVCAQTAASPAAVALTLETALARAMEANPGLVAARMRRSVDLAGRDVARERLNPEVRAEAERETPKYSYTFAVPLELGGKRGRRIDVSDAAIRTGEAELAVAILEVRASVRRTYFERVVADARVVLQGELRDLAVRVRDAAQQRFDAGSSPRLELVQAQLALSQVENDTAAAQATSVAARTQLNALLGLPLDAPSAVTTALDGGGVPPIQAAIARAEAGSVELALADRRLDEQRAKVALARALRVPDVTPEAAVTRNSEPEFNTGWRAAIAIGVPLFTRHRAGVQLEEATLAQLESERNATRARIGGDVTSAAALAQSQWEQFVRYRDQILPQALEVERMAEDSYRLGQTGIAAFLQALQAARDVRLRALQAGADLQRTLADLERAIGTPLP
jgi:cobalt-zinc-cadmium efflux system outer membrane protein